MSDTRDRCARHLAAAIQTMRDACEDAERRAKSGDYYYAIQNVMHALAWGMANSTSNIECAMRAVADEHAIELDRLRNG